jgi:hypothetical protein
MKKYRLIRLSPLELYNRSIDGLPWSLSRDSEPPNTPEGFSYVEELPHPGNKFLSEGKEWGRKLTEESFGWEQVNTPTLEEESNRIVEAWRIRVIARTTPFLDEMLIDKINKEVESIQDPLEKAIAEEVFFGGNTIDRESTLLNTMANSIGLTSSQIDDLFIQAINITV